MKLTLHYLLLNENFSPEYAEANHQGEETENNPKYEWEDEFDINDIDSFQIIRNGKLPLSGELPNGENFSVEVDKMCVIELLTSSKQKAYLGISESILESFEETENKITIYIKDYEPHANPMPGVYIASKEFPKELVF
ncbi:MAG: hypothetical protein V4622_10500 [Bacteroidota bacterium]